MNIFLVRQWATPLFLFSSLHRRSEWKNPHLKNRYIILWRRKTPLIAYMYTFSGKLRRVSIYIHIIHTLISRQGIGKFPLLWVQFEAPAWAPINYNLLKLILTHILSFIQQAKVWFIIYFEHVWIYLWTFISMYIVEVCSKKYKKQKFPFDLIHLRNLCWTDTKQYKQILSNKTRFSCTKFSTYFRYWPSRISLESLDQPFMYMLQSECIFPYT